MAYQIKNNKGFLVIKLSKIEIIALRDGHFGKCDLCEDDAEFGYLIAAIDSFYCPGCYKVWNDSATRFKSDIPDEENRFKMYKSDFIDFGTWIDEVFED